MKEKIGYLESIDFKFHINLSSPRIQASDVEKISDAWSSGHFIFWGVDSTGIEVYSVISKCAACNRRNEITKDWLAISKELLNQNIPNEWTNHALRYAAKVRRYVI